jgi:hypothetical protein
MNMENRGILITVIILILVACLLVCCAVAFGAGFYFSTSSSTGISVESDEVSDSESRNPAAEEEVPAPTLENSEVPASSNDPETENQPVDESSAGEPIPPEVAQQMDEIQMQVILERGLKPSENVDRNLYSSEQLQQRVLNDFLADSTPEDAKNDALTLAAFGLLEPDFDLHTFYVDLLSEQVAGFYDQETKEMVVVQGDRFGGNERLTYAHEYTHALQDQNYDIENGLNFNDEACEADSERCAAVQALIEGDASLAQLNWFFENATPEDQTDIMEFYNSFESPVFDSAPEFITMDFTFPYQYGLAFVESLYEKGGWGTVDRAYQDLPVSTEQILHPERYPDDRPEIVQLPDLQELLSENWEELDRGTMGEWYTYLILAKGLDTQARLDDDTAFLAAEGWGGDAYMVYYNPDTQETIMVLNTTWDTSEDADEFTTAFRDYAQDRFGSPVDDTWQGEDGVHAFYRNGDETAWILAPDAVITSLIWKSIQ